jgi:hypothetical protein
MARSSGCQVNIPFLKKWNKYSKQGAFPAMRGLTAACGVASLAKLA